MNAKIPGQRLWEQVRASFLLGNSELTFRKWCIKEGCKYENARKAFLGVWNGPKALKFRERAIEFAQQT